MASKKIREELLKKIGRRKMYSKMDSVRKIAEQSITSEVAMYVVASKEDIPVARILTKEKKKTELKELQDVLSKYNFENKMPRISKKNITEPKKEPKSPYSISLSEYNVDSELVQDCKLVKPYRIAIKEALLTLETKIQDLLKLDSTWYGVKLIDEVRHRKIFDRNDRSESDGLYFLFRGAIQWLRNPAGHKKINYTKEDALKIVLFSDYLIKLFDDLFHKRI